MQRVEVTTTDETLALGARLARVLLPGSVLCMTGDLGAGKTTFTKGIGLGLDVTEGIRSPTYGLIHFHAGGRIPLWHADLYRIEAENELEQIGLDEALLEDGVVIIEWAERFPSVLPADRLDITISESDRGRVVAFHPTGPHHRAIMASLHD